MTSVRGVRPLCPLLTQHWRTLALPLLGAKRRTSDVGVCSYCVPVSAFSYFIHLFFVDLLLCAGHGVG